MKKKIFSIFIFIVVLFYVPYNLIYKDLRGVFYLTKKENMRKTTKYIIVHHDAINRDCTVDEINDYQRDSCDYSCGFAYPLFIKGGKVYQVHDLNAKTAHTEGWNSQALAVCVHTADKNDIFTQFLLIVTLKFLMIYYNVPKENIKGHCDFNDTKCPEMNMEKLREWL